MDFFEHQHKARKNTGRLVFLFVVGVLVVAGLVGVLVAFMIGVGSSKLEDGSAIGALRLPVAGGAALLTMLVMGGASMGKSAQLAFGGGSAVAESLGGRLITRGTSSLPERRLLNIVEEMAIASGVPTPPVYLMDREHGINAFAAGKRPEAAVIGVTRGTVETMSRDELQGIIAHEFSHILNGDMRMNLRLMGWIHGLIVLSIIGNVLVRAAWYSGSGVRVRSSRNNNNDGGAGGIVILGIGLLVLGSVGMLFGRLIKAAVSRQREYLADASAVQFTRNPEGIGDALKKIAGIGSSVKHPHAAECSHMFFGSYSSLSSMMATHPPIHERIGRVDPRWTKLTGDQRSSQLKQLASNVSTLSGASVAHTSHAGASGFAGGAVAGVDDVTRERSIGPATSRSPRPSTEVIDSIGTVEEHRVGFAERAIAMLPKRVREASGEPFGASALLMAIVLSSQKQVQETQEKIIRSLKVRGLVDETRSLVPILDAVDPVLRLPTLDLLLPTLRALSSQQRAALVKAVLGMIRADQRIDVFEWALHRIVSIHLRGGEPLVTPKRTVLLAEKQACIDVLSVLSGAGTGDTDAKVQAFDRGVGMLGQAGVGSMTRERGKTLRDLDSGLEKLDNLSLAHKRVFLRACAAIVVDDRVVTVAEAELLRAVADSLGVPVPPIVLELRNSQL